MLVLFALVKSVITQSNKRLYLHDQYAHDLFELPMMLAAFFQDNFLNIPLGQPRTHSHTSTLFLFFSHITFTFIFYLLECYCFFILHLLCAFRKRRKTDLVIKDIWERIEHNVKSKTGDEMEEI